MSTAAYEKFVRAAAAALRAGDQPPRNRAEWESRAETLREKILRAVGGQTREDCPLQPSILGELRRGGHVIERLVFQTRPDVWMTANLYRPDPAPDRGPAVLVVHGHWQLARVDPIVQSRCLGLVKLGYTVLSVDAFGSGERYSYPAPGSYHGGLYGGTLWPTGETQLGIQIQENRRAIDYLLTRPEVDPKRIGITGASGGGNQSMYAGAFDPRIAAVAPVCSVGNYQSYLLVACCICEVIPGALTFTEEGDVLGLIAPRPLLVVNAGKDSVQFSPAEAEVSVRRARAIYDLYGAGGKLRHAVFDAAHGYDRGMREAMYGFMNRWLKGDGDGSAVTEPQFTIENPADLRCYPDPDDRPRTWLFAPALARKYGTERLASQFATPPTHKEDWESTAVQIRTELGRALGTMPDRPRPVAKFGPDQSSPAGVRTPVTLPGEPGLPLEAYRLSPPRSAAEGATLVIVSLDGADAALAHPLTKAAGKLGMPVVAADHRASGKYLGERRSRVPDHNQAEHGVWIGRPLLGQWVFETRCLLDWVAGPTSDRSRIILAGIGAGAMVALTSSALDSSRVSGTLLFGGPVSYLSDAAYGPQWRMGLIVPHLFRAGDIPQIASLIAPRRLVIANGVDAQGARVGQRGLREAFSYTTSIFKHLGPDRLHLKDDVDAGEALRLALAA